MNAESTAVPVIVGISDDEIEESAAAKAGYNPPTDEPLHDRIVLDGSPRTEVWVTGRKHDLIDIVSDYALVARDYVREDSFFTVDDVRGNRSVIAVRAGRKNDLAVFYGLVYADGPSRATAVDVVRFYIRDGSDIDIVVRGLEVFVTYGRKKDLRTRFAYQQANGWKRSPGNNRGNHDFPPATEPVPHARLP